MSKIKSIVDILAEFEKGLDEVDKLSEELKLKILNDIEIQANSKSQEIIEEFKKEKEKQFKEEEEKAKRDAEKIMKEGEKTLEAKRKELEKKLELAKNKAIELLL
ncbi:MAG TPA: hypothetical protein VKU94_02730 [Geobacterales bacterium]|nr:hypothetical protein [Geobacterales bacterium]